MCVIHAKCNSWACRPSCYVLNNLGKGVYTRRNYSLACLAVVVRLLLSLSYLVDPASSHMLVSKIKPCMSKFKPFMVKLQMAH